MKRGWKIRLRRRVIVTNKELLDWAAKAAKIAAIEREDLFNDDGTLYRLGWDPLNDNGDALHLAVRLGISIEFGYCLDDAPVVRCYSELSPGKSEHPNFPDPCAATRRAIVIAAAEIGKGMP
jgi:hypothetical protein